ncbi:MAG TPA: sulfurtransferase, partial [Oceanospirillales bacterium]|nr:sulfurtransferase [Oceanospirillales bacterium]
MTISTLLFLGLFLSTTLGAEGKIETKKNSSLDIDTATLQEKIKTDKNLVLIDVRTPSEITLLGGSINHPNEINIPRGWLEFQIKDEVADLDTPIVVYCG